MNFKHSPQKQLRGDNMNEKEIENKIRNTRKTSPISIAITTVFTALTCVATIIFSIYVPSTKGFFNIGESMVFLSALLFGPFVGAFAGGVGSMIADLLLGYPHYAPATLIIKACEGYVVGLLKNKTPRLKSKGQWKIFTILLGVIAGILLAYVGATHYSGLTEITLGFTSISLLLPSWFWLLLGAVLAFFTALTGFITEPEFGWTIFSVIIGGFVMVFGYFVYQMFFIGWIFNIQAVALAEVPINIGQMIVGATVALPVAKIVQRAFPYLKRAS
jgi:uncharacterized membrane protein